MTIVERQAIASAAGKPYAEVIQKDGTLKKVDIEIVPYGASYVSILSGLKSGDVLKNQASSASGRLRVTGGGAVPSSGNSPSGPTGEFGGGPAPMMR